MNVYSYAKSLAPLLIAGLMSMPSQADSPMVWSNNSVSLLSGGNFKVTGDNASALTFEHASGWTKGDLFLFVDFIDYHDNPFQSSGWYGEFSPRFSLNKMGLFELASDDFVQDVSIATTYERGKGDTEALLIGLGTSLNISGFNFFNMNIYARKDTGLGDGFDDVQVTFSWSKGIKMGEQSIVIDGFLDYVVGWGSQSPSLHIVPQVKWDIGQALGLQSGKVLLGAELDYWRNKFGINSSAVFKTNQFAPSAILKVHF